MTVDVITVSMEFSAQKESSYEFTNLELSNMILAFHVSYSVITCTIYVYNLA